MWGALEKAVGDDMVPDNSHYDLVGRHREDVEHVCDLIDRSAMRDEGEDCGAGACGGEHGAGHGVRLRGQDVLDAARWARRG
jgi:hypothetical protein